MDKTGVDGPTEAVEHNDGDQQGHRKIKEMLRDSSMVYTRLTICDDARERRPSLKCDTHFDPSWSLKGPTNKGSGRHEGTPGLCPDICRCAESSEIFFDGSRAS